MWRVLLIAEREFKAYATTGSFWVSLLMGPMLMGLAALAMGAMRVEPASHVVSIRTERAEVADIVKGSLQEAAALSGQAVEFAPPDTTAGTQITIRNGRAEVTDGRVNKLEAALLRRDLYSIQLADQLAAAGLEPEPRSVPKAAKPAVTTSAKPGTNPVAQFAPVFLLWLTLIGALGMLLQSVVRERANRALEHLLAGARPAEIVFGKLLGVGAVSLLVLATWMIGSAALAATSLGSAPSMLAGLASPAAAAYAGAIYVMAFLLYGSALVCIGAFASDLPTAQNLSRPVFGLLLIIFFLAMGSVLGLGEQLAWLIWLPPFTPFMLLLSPEGALSPWQHAALWTLMGASTVAITAAASRTLIISPRPLWARKAA